MVSLDNSQTSQTSKVSKTENKSSQTSTSSEKSKDKPALSFAELLKGVTDKSSDEKDIDTKPLLELSEEDTKGLSKLNLSEVNIKSLDALPKQSQTSEIKGLISDAKQYLKSQITQTEGFKKSEVKELPKTLDGLIKTAEKFGVDVSKISLEKVQSKNKNIGLTQLEDKTKNSKLDIKSSKDKILQIEDKKIQINSKVSETPINVEKKISTEELLQAKKTKDIKKDTNSSKKSGDESLKSLLSGTKIEKKDINTDKLETQIVVDDKSSKMTKGLESLLSVDSSDNNSKVDTSSVHKADSLEVKMNEAKQMVKYLSQDVKQAIDDYKSPFTRIKVQLNPEKLGEVDLTVIQRGKDLIVNVSSNNSAINTLSMNANELRTQLNNNGINNATLNFSNNSQTEQQGSFEQQNNQHNQKQAQQEYGYFDNEEQNEEILSSLEIVVPNYA